MFGKILCSRNNRGLETSVVKILFISISLVLASVAIKMSYDALGASKVAINITGASQSPVDAIGNLTALVASAAE